MKNLESLTPRQMEITELVAEGKEMKEIAEILSITSGTVGNTLTRIYQKVNVANKAELAALYGYYQALEQYRPGEECVTIIFHVHDGLYEGVNMTNDDMAEILGGLDEDSALFVKYGRFIKRINDQRKFGEPDTGFTLKHPRRYI